METIAATLEEIHEMYEPVCENSQGQDYTFYKNFVLATISSN